MKNRKLNLRNFSVESFITGRSAVVGGKPFTTDPALDTKPENTARGCCEVSGNKNC
ncbi:MAG: hypothetical protein WBH03_20675 [Cyclobacteriaceae bacterium]